MFLGHYGAAFAAKRVAPRTSLGALSFAAQFLDELWPILLLLGVEQVEIVPSLIRRQSSTVPSERVALSVTPLDFTYYPFSHSLVMAVVWGILIGGVYFLLRRYGRGAWVMGLLVVSHWFLDLPMHRADLPLWPGASSPKLGWGVWNSIAATYVIEFGIYAIGITLYLRATRARDRIGSWGGGGGRSLWGCSFFFWIRGGPPPGGAGVGGEAAGFWVFGPWGGGGDKTREYEA